MRRFKKIKAIVCALMVLPMVIGMLPLGNLSGIFLTDTYAAEEEKPVLKSVEVEPGSSAKSWVAIEKSNNTDVDYTFIVAEGGGSFMLGAEAETANDKVWLVTENYVVHPKMGNVYTTSNVYEISNGLTEVSLGKNNYIVVGQTTPVAAVKFTPATLYEGNL